MGRRRTKHLDLPPRMRPKPKAGGKIAYYYDHGTDPIDGKRKWEFLSEDLKEARLKWAQIENTRSSVDGTIAALFSFYFASAHFKELADKTQEMHRMWSKQLLEVFGRMQPDQVLPSHIGTYLEAHPKPVTANRQISLLSKVYRISMRKGLASRNPCQGIERNKEESRGRYIEDRELRKLMRAADPQVRCMIWLCYLTSLRREDILKIKRADIRPEGLYVEVSKRRFKKRTKPKRVLFSRSPSLDKVLTRAKKLERKIGSLYLFANRQGQRYTGDGFDSIWQRVKQRAGITDVHFHDIRGKALTDAERARGILYAKDLAAHTDHSMTQDYIRPMAVKEVAPLR